MPQVAAIASLAMTGIGTAFSVAGALSNRKFQKAQGEQNARIAHFKGQSAKMEAVARAGVAERNRKSIDSQTQMELAKKDSEKKGKGAKLMSALAKRNLEIDSVSADDLKFAEDLQSDFESNIVLWEGSKKQEGLMFEAEQQEGLGNKALTFGAFEAFNIQANASNRATASLYSAFGSGFSGVAKMAGDTAGYFGDGTFG
jgi:hypothetical protein